MTSSWQIQMTEISHTWSHETLGTFTYDYVGWSRKLELPAFNRFRYVWGGGQRASATVELSFVAEDAGDDRPEEPNGDCIHLANLIIANQHALNELLLEAVWQDLNGLGPSSGMWWHGDWPTIREMIRSGWKHAPPPPPLDSKDDLYSHLGNLRIYINDDNRNQLPGCARFAFDSAIDPEHGVGVLCDGRKILGVGYSYDSTPYRTP